MKFRLEQLGDFKDYALPKPNIMILTLVNHKDLNSQQKKNYNLFKVAYDLAYYGYYSMKLNNDWQGADLIAVKDE